MPEEEVSPPNEGAGEAVDGGTPPVVDGSAATTEKGERWDIWFIEMRGFVMMLAVEVASFTYQAGLNPPGHLFEPEDRGSDNKTAKSIDPFRYKVFLYSNTTAFLMSLAIIILLMNRRSSYVSLAKVMVLEIIVALDMMGLMAAYWAGTTHKHDQTNKQNQTNINILALVLAALVLFVMYHVIYAVQLEHKLRDLFPANWGLFPPAVPERAATRGDDGTPPVPNRQGIINDGTRAPPTLDIGRSEAELRRRDSRLVARTPGKSTMLSP